MINQEELQKMYDDAQKTLKMVEESNFPVAKKYDDFIYSEKDADSYGWYDSSC